MSTRTRSEIARQAALARWGRKPPPVRDLSLFVEVVPGVWQPQEMTAAERWKQQMHRRRDGES